MIQRTNTKIPSVLIALIFSLTDFATIKNGLQIPVLSKSLLGLKKKFIDTLLGKIGSNETSNSEKMVEYFFNYLVIESKNTMYNSWVDCLRIGKIYIDYPMKNNFVENKIGYYIHDKQEEVPYTFFQKGDAYIGQLMFDPKEKMAIMEGMGLLMYYDSEWYVGALKENLFNGKGVLFSKGINRKSPIRMHKDQEGQQEELMYYGGTFDKGNMEGEGESCYSDGKICYKGTWVTGEYSGYGAYYNRKGRLVYKGEFLFGYAWGRGKLYYPEGKDIVCYIGGFKEGLPSGIGTYYFLDGKPCYNGVFNKGMSSSNQNIDLKKWFVDSKLIVNYKNGNLHYYGNFKNNKLHGKGLECYEDGSCKYIGDYSEGLFNGEGKLYRPDGTLYYTGSFYQGMFHGKGEIKDCKGNIRYSGSFQNGLFHGRGIKFHENNDYYMGDFHSGKEHGVCHLHFKNGYLYIGSITSGECDGKRDIYNSKGVVIYRGNINEKVFNQIGVSTFNNGVIVDSFKIL